MAGVDRYEDLDTWQLSVELRDRIFAWIEASPQVKNWKFRDQILDASISPPRNIAEGFGRFRPREFASFVRIARAPNEPKPEPEPQSEPEPEPEP
jgi:four helix bundle protein